MRPDYKPSPVIVSRESPVKALILTPAFLANPSVTGTSSFIYGLNPTIATIIKSQSYNFSVFSS